MTGGMTLSTARVTCPRAGSGSAEAGELVALDVQRHHPHDLGVGGREVEALPEAEPWIDRLDLDRWSPPEQQPHPGGQHRNHAVDRGRPARELQVRGDL